MAGGLDADGGGGVTGRGTCSGSPNQILLGVRFTGVQAEQFPIPVALQEAIESLHEAGLAVGIGLGDVLHVGPDEDQTAGAAFAFAGGNPGTDAALSSFEFGFLFRQFFPELTLFSLVGILERPEAVGPVLCGHARVAQGNQKGPEGPALNPHRERLAVPSGMKKHRIPGQRESITVTAREGQNENPG